MTEYPSVQTSVRGVRKQLGAILKSDVAIEPLAHSRAGAFRSFVSPAISVIDVQGGAIVIHKSVSRAADVHLLWLQRGAVQVTHEAGCTHLQAGQFVAVRGEQALQFRHEQRIELSAVYLPAGALERWLPDWQAAELIAVSMQQAEGRLSFDIARDLLASGHGLQHRDDAALVAETVTRLMARSLALTSLSEVAAPEDLAEACRRKVRHHCRKHLGAPGLSVESVARATGLSRATLHRLFRDQPHTLMQWVQLERLQACKRLLDATCGSPRTLTEIALSQGFKSSAHFSAAFRQRYGQAPRDYRLAVRDQVRKRGR